MKKIYIFCYLCWGGGGGGDFFLQRIEIYTFFFFGGGDGMEGVVWRGGSVARVSEFFFYKYSKYKKKQLSSF